MKILIVGINYSPELTGIGKYTSELAAYLARVGHDVRVITAPPYYPEWKVHPGYAGRGYWKTEEQGVTVYRVPIWVPAQVTGTKRMIHLLSFTLASFPVVMGQLFWRPDVVWTVEPSLMSTPVPLLVAKLGRAGSWLHIQDYEVDAAFDLNILRGALVRKLARKFDHWLMSKFDRVSSISLKMVARAKQLAVAQEKLYLFRNWVDIASIYPLSGRTKFRDELGISDETVVVLYSGNMGQKQGLEVLPLAARHLLDRKDIVFLLCGSGAGKNELVALAEGLPNVKFLDLQPLERLNELLGTADIHVLPQKANAADLVMPSKLTGMFASGRAVVATADAATELGSVLQGRGRLVRPGADLDLALEIRALANDSDMRASLGAAGREYAESELSGEGILRKFSDELVDIAQRARARAGKGASNV